MKRKLQIKSVIVLFMAIFVSVNMFAYDFEVDGIYYNKNADDTTVSVMYSNLEAVVIPSQVTYEDNTYIVTHVGVEAFKDCTKLKSVTIPNSVVTISYSAFEGCTDLKNIVLPNSVTEILDGAFNGCTSLERIMMPNSVTSIGLWAFQGCSNLITIRIGSATEYIGNGAFADCTNVDTIICKGKNPVFISIIGEVNYIFAGIDPKVCIVPCGTKDAYAAAEIWQGFNIVEDFCVNVITGEATDITNSSAKLNATVETNGEVLAKGFQYKKTIDEMYITIDISTETFDYTLTELDEGSEYVFRAFAVVGEDTTFGEQRTFVALDDSGIEEVINPDTFTIYPNPTQDIVFIEKVIGSMEEISIKVYDMQGKLVFEDININAKRYILHTKSFEKGVYYVKIGNMTQKLVVE